MDERQTKYKVNGKFEFEPRDLWIGLYIDYHRIGSLQHLDLYFTIIPMLPYHVTIIRYKFPFYSKAQLEAIEESYKWR